MPETKTVQKNAYMRFSEAAVPFQLVFHLGLTRKLVSDSTKKLQNLVKLYSNFQEQILFIFIAYFLPRYNYCFSEIFTVIFLGRFWLFWGLYCALDPKIIIFQKMTTNIMYHVSV